MAKTGGEKRRLLCAAFLVALFYLNHVDSKHDTSSGQVSAKVQSRYEELPYPSQDDVKALWFHIKKGPIYLDKILHRVYDDRFDMCSNDTPVRILIAGCGTGIQLAMLGVGMLVATKQCLFVPQWQIVCMDLSSSSLDIARSKAALIGMESHVKFVQKDILLLDPAVDGAFDIIEAIGVLHHMADTRKALSALQSVLRRGGVMHLMLYNRFGREVRDLHRVQGAIRLLNQAAARKAQHLHSTEVDLRMASMVIDSLPATHPHVMYDRRGGDADRWEGLADRYMHPHEATFEPREIFALAADLLLRGFVPDDALPPVPGSPHMRVQWEDPEEYDPHVAAPGMWGQLDLAMLEPSEAAQLAHQVIPLPPQNHYFYLVTPEEWRPVRFTNPAVFKVGLKFGVLPAEFQNAWRDLGRLRKATEPFGTPLEINYTRVGQLNARSLTQVGLGHMADAALAAGRALDQKKGKQTPLGAHTGL